MLVSTFKRLVGLGARSLLTVSATFALNACGESPAFQHEPQTPAQAAPYLESEDVPGQTQVGPDPTPPTDASQPTLPTGNGTGDQQGESTQSSAPADYDAQADADPSALTDFRGELAPYGEWHDDSSYGTVWTPSPTYVGAEFAPYVTAGHWALDDGGAWLWVSDYSWGWGPFHYGRWVWISDRGWSWIPGRVYAPAWVVWRTGYYGDYYLGWAPMPPSWYWRGGLAMRVAVIPPAAYVFCPSTHIFHPSVHAHILPPARVATVAPYTRPYVPAVAASPAGAYRAAAIPRGPALASAHVPSSAIPSQRVAAPARAIAYARTAPAVQRPMASPALRSSAMGPSAAPPMRGPAVVAPAAPMPAARTATLPAYPRSAPIAPSAPAFAPTMRPSIAPPAMPRAAIAPSVPHSSAPSVTPHFAPSVPHTSTPHFSAPHVSAPSPHVGGGGHFRR